MCIITARLFGVVVLSCGPVRKSARDLVVSSSGTRLCLHDSRVASGSKNLETQNHCLMLKFIHKVFTGDSAPWRTWLLRDIGSYLNGGILANTFLGRLINDEFDRYPSLNRVIVHNDKSTSFLVRRLA